MSLSFIFSIFSFLPKANCAVVFYISALPTVDFVNVILFFYKVFQFMENIHFHLLPLFSTIVCANCPDFVAILSCTRGTWVLFFAIEPNLCTVKFSFYDFDKCFFTFSSDKQQILDRFFFNRLVPDCSSLVSKFAVFVFFLHCLQ